MPPHAGLVTARGSPRYVSFALEAVARGPCLPPSAGLKPARGQTGHVETTASGGLIGTEGRSGLIIPLDTGGKSLPKATFVVTGAIDWGPNPTRKMSTVWLRTVRSESKTPRIADSGPAAFPDIKRVHPRMVAAEKPSTDFFRTSRRQHQTVTVHRSIRVTDRRVVADCLSARLAADQSGTFRVLPSPGPRAKSGFRIRNRSS